MPFAPPASCHPPPRPGGNTRATSCPVKRIPNRPRSLPANAAERSGLGHAKLRPEPKHIRCAVTETINGPLKIPWLGLALIGSGANERPWGVPGVPGRRQLGGGPSKGRTIGWGAPYFPEQPLSFAL